MSENSTGALFLRIIYKRKESMMNEREIQELINKSRMHDMSAFTLLVKENQQLVFRLAFRLLCNEEEARDMVQETFVKVWQSLDKYNPEFRFSTWIYKIAANVCYDRLRSLQHTPSGDLRGVSLDNLFLSSEENMEQNLINKDLKELILRFIEKLTPKQKLVFTLREIEGLEVAEVEAITGLSAEKIKSNLYQARKQIRMKINQLEDDR